MCEDDGAATCCHTCYVCDQLLLCVQDHHRAPLSPHQSQHRPCPWQPSAACWPAQCTWMFICTDLHSTMYPVQVLKRDTGVNCLTHTLCVCHLGRPTALSSQPSFAKTTSQGAANSSTEQGVNVLAHPPVGQQLQCACVRPLQLLSRSDQQAYSLQAHPHVLLATVLIHHLQHAPQADNHK